jgi:hypothetical protein
MKFLSSFAKRLSSIFTGDNQEIKDFAAKWRNRFDPNGILNSLSDEDLFSVYMTVSTEYRKISDTKPDKLPFAVIIEGLTPMYLHQYSIKGSAAALTMLAEDLSQYQQSKTTEYFLKNILPKAQTRVNEVSKKMEIAAEVKKEVKEVNQIIRNIRVSLSSTPALNRHLNELSDANIYELYSVIGDAYFFAAKKRNELPLSHEIVNQLLAKYLLLFPNYPNVDDKLFAKQIADDIGKYLNYQGNDFFQKFLLENPEIKNLAESPSPLIVTDTDRKRYRGMPDELILEFKRGQQFAANAWANAEEEDVCLPPPPPQPPPLPPPTGVSYKNFSLKIPQSTAVAVGHNIIPHQTQYTLVLENLSDRKADCTVWIDGVQVGAWRVNAKTHVTIERSIHDVGKFTFYALGSAEGYHAGLSPDNPKLGLIEARFVPEKIYEQPAFSKSATQPVLCSKLARPPARTGNATNATGGTGYSGVSKQTFGTADRIVEYDFANRVTLTIHLWDTNQPRPLLKPVNQSLQYA